MLKRMNSLLEITLAKIFNKEESRLKYASTGNSGDYVILLHGLNRSSRSLSKLANTLAEEGYQVINFSYPSRKYDIDALASLFLGNLIKKYCLNKKKKIHFVTHSLGGIIVRKYLQDTPIINIGRTVMITPPNHGTKLIDFLKQIPVLNWILGRAGKQLSSDTSSYVNKLHKKVNFDAGIIAGSQSYNPISYFLLDSKNDGTITVSSTKITGMKDFIEIKTGHFFAPNNDEVIKNAVNFINYGFF